MQAVYIKDPNATLPFGIDWSTYLAAAPPIGAEVGPLKITASSWEVPTDLVESAPSFTDTATQIMLAGGVLNTDYLIYNLITFDTATGTTPRTDRGSLILKLRDAVVISPPSELEQQLSALRVALGTKAAKDTAEYQIANRMKRTYSFEDLLRWEARLTELVNAERRRAGGPGFFKNHFVRPTVPGG